MLYVHNLRPVHISAFLFENTYFLTRFCPPSSKTIKKGDFYRQKRKFSKTLSKEEDFWKRRSVVLVWTAKTEFFENFDVTTNYKVAVGIPVKFQRQLQARNQHIKKTSELCLTCFQYIKIWDQKMWNSQFCGEFFPAALWAPGLAVKNYSNRLRSNSVAWRHVASKSSDSAVYLSVFFQTCIA